MHTKAGGDYTNIFIRAHNAAGTIDSNVVSARSFGTHAFVAVQIDRLFVTYGYEDGVGGSISPRELENGLISSFGVGGTTGSGAETPAMIITNIISDSITVETQTGIIAVLVRQSTDLFTAPLNVPFKNYVIANLGVSVNLHITT